MSKKYVSLKILNSMEDHIVETLLNKPIKVLCKNFNLEQNEIKSFNILYKRNNNFWNDPSSTTCYYILEDEILSLNIIEKSEISCEFSENYNELTFLSDKERIDLMVSNKIQLEQIASNPIKTRDEISEAIATCTTATILLNKVIFDDLIKLSPDVAKIKSKAAYIETREIIKLISKIITSYSGDFSMFSSLVNQSNGTTIQHMTRTFVRTLSFLIFYNSQIESGYVTKIRVKFNKKYRDLYNKICLHENNNNPITLERVFKGGMRSISECDTYAMSVGFLLHDIGKQTDIKYFESSDGYIKEIIESHVFIGFNELLKKTVYPPEIAAIVGLHHEYYGDRSGYGPLKGILKKILKSTHKHNYCMSYSLKDIYNGDALSFFPVKILEIVDIYDALTDSERKYRAPFKPAEAIIFIRNEFLNDQIKIDPILFDIFERYLINTGEITQM